MKRRDREGGERRWGEGEERKQRGNLACTSPEGITLREREGEGGGGKRTEQKTNLSCCAADGRQTDRAREPVRSLFPLCFLIERASLVALVLAVASNGIRQRKRLCLCPGRYNQGGRRDAEIEREICSFSVSSLHSLPTSY